MVAAMRNSNLTEVDWICIIRYNAYLQYFIIYHLNAHFKMSPCVIQSFVCPTNAQLNCYKMLEIYIKIYNKFSYMFRFNQNIIREPTVCASLKLQHWCQLKLYINPLKTKRRPFYLKTQSVPRCKHFSPRL